MLVNAGCRPEQPFGSAGIFMLCSLDQDRLMWYSRALRRLVTRTYAHIQSSRLDVNKGSRNILARNVAGITYRHRRRTVV